MRCATEKYEIASVSTAALPQGSVFVDFFFLATSIHGYTNSILLNSILLNIVVDFFSDKYSTQYYIELPGESAAVCVCVCVCVCERERERERERTWTLSIHTIYM
jgi:hypothetical protein